MNAIRQVLVAEFYRRNFLFFLLVIILLVFVFRPPSLLISPWFVLPMLESLPFFGLVSGLILLYDAKCWWDLWHSIHRQENQFLYALAILPVPRLCRVLLGPIFGVLAPGILYLLIIAAYSIYANSWHVWAILGIHLIILPGISLHLAHAIRHPREVRIRHGWQSWLEARFKESFVFIALQTLIRYHPLGFLLTKSLIWALMILTMISHHLGPFTEKGLELVLLSLAALQLMLAYWLRESEDRLIFSLRNLPISRFRRFSDYLLVALLLFLPEALLWIGGNGYGLGIALSEAGAYLLTAMAFFLLGVSFLYYQPFSSVQYLRIGFAAYLIFFLAVLFQLGLWLPSMLMVGLAFLIFMEEYLAWDGFHRE